MSAGTLEGFRLSPQQRRVWALIERDGEGPYRVAAEFRLDGDVDPESLSRALHELAARHEILRTTFRRLPGMAEPLQVIHDRSMVAFERARTGAWGPFTADLAGGPLSRVVWRGESARDTRMLFDFSALTADAVSLEELARELVACLAPARPGPDIGHDEVLQYADVAEWWNELEGKPESAPAMAFWRALEWPAASPELPFDPRPPGNREFLPERTGSAVAAEMVARLEDLSRALAVPPSTVLLTVWCVLIQRLVGDASVFVGRETDGRRAPELRAAVGPFAHVLPLRVALDDDLPFRDAVARVAGAVAEEEPWADLYPAHAARSRSIPPILHSFAWREERPVATDGIRLALEAGRSVADRFTARLSALRREEALDLDVDYDAARLGRSDAESLRERCVRLLESALDDPSRAIGALDLLPESERRLLVAWNDTGRDFSDRRPIHERFEEAASRTPDSVALVCDRSRLTCSELNARANAVAHRLREAGVAPETVVGLLIERSVEMVVGLLAIWKAGGAYLPLDPSLPPERLSLMLEDSRARFLLTRSDLRGRVPAGEARVFLVDEPAAGNESNPEPSASPENLAYVLFTSGSTGVPKGVAVEHRQVSNYVDGILERLQPLPGSSYATVTTLAADLGNTCLFPSLATGGRLHVVTEQRSADPEGLAEDFERDPVDYLKIVPSHLSALLTGSRPGRILPARCLILGGEAPGRELVARVRELAPRCRVINHYGPTEATIGATTYTVPEDARGDDDARGPVPIGRPLPNCRVYLLDRRGALVPRGVAGELHIAGAGLARGYFGRPELTAERFVEREVAGARQRLYRTGDLGRHRADGAIEWLGRTDDQVKIHGFRIEPGEIEAALQRHPSVMAAVVLPRTFPDGSRRLVGYFVAPEREALVPELRRLLLARLPEFMVPSAFVALPRLPLTANGKIDRGALPAPSAAHAPRGSSAAPTTPEEKVLARVWADVLRADAFGVHDNFFELGGDSILAIQIIARAAREGLRLTPRQLFEHQTIAELSRVAQAPLPISDRDTVEAGPVPLTPIQRWFFGQNLSDPQHYNQSMLLEARRPLDPERLRRAVASLVARHDALRLRFFRDGEAWRQRLVAAEDGEPFAVVRLAGGGEAARAASLEASIREVQASLDLARGPLVKIVYFDTGEDAARLLIVVHHLAVDGVSWRVLLEDLEKAYRDLEAGDEIRLLPPTSSFRRWAEAVSRVAASGDLQAEADYWLAAAAAETPVLPLDARGENTVESARAVHTALSEEETAALLQEVPAAYRTQINDALVAAVAQAFARWTGARSLSLDVEGHGREDISPDLDLSRTVGWFTARFPVHVVLPESLDPTEGLLAVKEQLRAIPGRGVGYGILRYLAGDDDRWTSRSEPPVSFNYLGQLDQQLSRESIFRRLASPGFNRSPRDRRRHVLAIEARVTGGRLRIAWIYSRNLHRRATIERLAAAFEEAIRSVIERSRSAAPSSYTPADFPQARMSQKDLDKLVARIKAGGRP